MTTSQLEQATKIKNQIKRIEEAIKAAENGHYIYFQTSPGSSVGISVDELGEEEMRVLRNSCQDVLTERKLILEQAFAAI